jgi:hypothetical protein
LTFTVLFLWDALSDERTGLSFVCAAGLCQRSLSRVRIPWNSRPYFTVSDSRLPFSSPSTTRRSRWRYSIPPPHGNKACVTSTQLTNTYPFVTTITYYTLTRLHNYNPYTMSSRIHTSKSARSLLRSADCLPDNPSAQTTRKTVAPFLSCASDILATVVALFCWRLPGNEPKHSSQCCMRQDGGSSPGNCVNTCDVIAAVQNCCADGCLATRNNIRNSIVACVYSVAGCVT